jgi:hypothetical protein
MTTTKPGSGTDALLTLFVTMPLLLLLHGVVLGRMWGWFVVPALGAPPISTGQAIGLALMAAMFWPSSSSNEQRSWLDMVVLGAINGLLLLGFGALVHAVLC